MAAQFLRAKPTFPQLNRSHPLAQGLVFDHNAFERSGNKTTEVVNVTTGTITGATWDNHNYGADLDYSAASSVVTFTTPSTVNGLTKLSLEGLVYLRGGGGGGLGRVFNKGGATSRFYILTGDSQANQLSFTVAYNTTNGFWRYNSAFPSNVWTHFVLTYDGTSTANNPTLYLNAVVTSSSSSQTPSGTWNTDDGTLYVGNVSAGTRNWDGKISHLRIWNRLLSSQEASALYADPFQIYRKKSITSYLF